MMESRGWGRGRGNRRKRKRRGKYARREGDL